MATDYTTEWKFIADAYNGTGPFFDGSAIEQFSREDDEAYANRKNQAMRRYQNIFKSKVTRYIGYLFKTPPIRQADNDMLQLIMADMTRTAKDVNVFMSDFAKNAKARGVNLMLIDSPEYIGTTKAEQVDGRLLPYAVEILPERLTEWRVDEFGAFEYAAFTDTIDRSTFGHEDIIDIVRYYDKEEWRVYTDSGELLDSGLHGLNVCPLLIFSENGELETTGEFSQLAGLSQEFYNRTSEKKHMLRGQTFSLLTVFTEKGTTPDIKIGVDSVLLYSGDKPPAFISADAAQTELYTEEQASIIESMDRVAYDVSTTKAQESGISLEIKFQGLNSSLNSFAQSMEQLERRAWQLICDKLGIPRDSITVSYNLEFSITDLNTEIETLDGVNAIADLPLYKSEKLKQIVKEDLINSDPEILDAIFEEIDVTVGKTAELE